MRYATDIRLEELIVHIVNPRKSDGFVLSQRTVPLDGNDRLKQYFVDHIRNSLTDPATKAASFINQQWQRYQILIKNFSSRRLRFEQRLYSQKVEEIIETQIDTSKIQFIQSFWITISIYLVVIILAILASVFLPKIMNVSSPKTLPSPKQTPQNSPKPANTHLTDPNETAISSFQSNFKSTQFAIDEPPQKLPVESYQSKHPFFQDPIGDRVVLD